MIQRLSVTLNDEEANDNHDKVANLQNIIKHYNSKLEDVESQVHILENTGQIFNLQHQIEIDLVNLEENNRRILEDLSEEHDNDLQRITIELELE